MVVVEGRMFVAMVDGSRPVQRHLGGRPGGQTGLDTLKAHPHSRVHCPSQTSLRVVFNHNCLNRVYPHLIVL